MKSTVVINENSLPMAACQLPDTSLAAGTVPGLSADCSTEWYQILRFRKLGASLYWHSRMLVVVDSVLSNLTVRRHHPTLGATLELNRWPGFPAQQGSLFCPYPIELQ